MIKKLTHKGQVLKRGFVERKASIHICDSNCEIHCNLEPEPQLTKLVLLGSLYDVY